MYQPRTRTRCGLLIAICGSGLSLVGTSVETMRRAAKQDGRR
jgi:hypothetical protein